MKEYKIKVVELHKCTKTYYIDAENMKEAKARAKVGDWDDASETVPTGDIEKYIIKSAKENK